VLAYRWRRNRQKQRDKDEDEDEELEDLLLDDDDDVKMMQAGLLVSSERNSALPDSVTLNGSRSDCRTCWRRCINMSVTFIGDKGWRKRVRDSLRRQRY